MTSSRESTVWLGLQGATCAGKSEFAQCLSKVSGNAITVINLDRFYLEFDRLANPVSDYNFDDPRAIDWNMVIGFISECEEKKEILIPNFNYKTGLRDSFEKKNIRKYVLIEGLWPFWRSEILSRFDLKIFIDTPLDIRLIRRIRRDVLCETRGWTLESLLLYYEKHVRPSELKYVFPGKDVADMCIDGTDNLEANALYIWSQVIRLC